MNKQLELLKAKLDEAIRIIEKIPGDMPFRKIEDYLTASKMSIEIELGYTAPGIPPATKKSKRTKMPRGKPSVLQKWILEMIERGNARFHISAPDAGSQRLARWASVYKNGIEGEPIPLNTWYALINHGWVEIYNERTGADIYGWWQDQYYQISEAGRKALNSN